MTQFTASMIPASIVTTEALATWLAEIHQRLYSDKENVEFLDVEGNEVARLTVESGKYFLTAPATPEWRHASRISLKLRDGHQTGPAWNFVETLGDKAIPNDMKAA